MIDDLTDEVVGLKVLVVTAVERLDTMRDAADAGAHGCLSKRAGRGELRDAIITVFGGGTVFGSTAGPGRERNAQLSSSTPLAGLRRQLTPRERQVLALVALGKTDKEVAEHLSLSHRTVQNHLAAVRRKTGMRRRTEMASWAIQHGSADR